MACLINTIVFQKILYLQYKVLRDKSQIFYYKVIMFVIKKLVFMIPSILYSGVSDCPCVRIQKKKKLN